jgi:hypothetical protein
MLYICQDFMHIVAMNVSNLKQNVVSWNQSLPLFVTTANHTSVICTL